MSDSYHVYITLTNDNISRRNSDVTENMNKQLIEEISKHKLAIRTDEMKYSAENLRLTKRSYRSSLLRRLGHSRRVQILPSIEILLRAISALAITSPVIPKKHV